MCSTSAAQQDSIMSLQAILEAASEATDIPVEDITLNLDHED